MRRFIANPLKDTPETLMKKTGYVRHCVENGETCYHRQLNDPAFPRFHALVSIRTNGMEIDLHFDALDSITHRGNHDQSWAYEGGRVNIEMQRIMETITGNSDVGHVVHSN